MTEIKVLFDSPFLQLRSIEDSEKGIKPYYYKHVKLYNGSVIAILPYRYTNYPLGFNKEFLLINEMRPAWSIDKLISASLTGGVEKGSYPEATAVKELKEEAGYTVEESNLEYLGTTYSAKASDTIVHLFAVDVTDLVPELIKGDGTGLESMSKPIWVTVKELTLVMDPLVIQMYFRFANK